MGFYLFQTFTALILILAANTSFAAFPRLAAILAEDYFFPRNFAYRGDRLAYTAGIIVLAAVAAAAAHRASAATRTPSSRSTRWASSWPSP